MYPVTFPVLHLDLAAVNTSTASERQCCSGVHMCCHLFRRLASAPDVPRLVLVSLTLTQNPNPNRYTLTLTLTLLVPAGILLAVTIIYQYFETYEKEKAQSANLW